MVRFVVASVVALAGAAELAAAEWNFKTVLRQEFQFDDNTRSALLKDSGSDAELRFDTEANREQSAEQISRMLQLVVSTIDYQFA